MADRGIHDRGATQEHVSSAAGNDVITSRVESNALAGFIVNADGELEWGGGTSATDWKFKRNASTSVGWLSSSTEVMRVTSTSASGETNLQLYCLIGGTSQLTRVSMGAADSGATGYRYLRVPNSATG